MRRVLAAIFCCLWSCVPAMSETGIASWYCPGFEGKKTASGETYDCGLLTAAHKTLPFGTRVKVTNRDNGMSVIVRIIDRGPFIRGRIIDLSRAAKLAIQMEGLAQVTIEQLRSSAGG